MHRQPLHVETSMAGSFGTFVSSSEKSQDLAVLLILTVLLILVVLLILAVSLPSTFGGFANLVGDVLCQGQVFSVCL